MLPLHCAWCRGGMISSIGCAPGGIPGRTAVDILGIMFLRGFTLGTMANCAVGLARATLVEHLAVSIHD